MGTISFTQINDGENIDASDVNNPLNTIYSEFNGNIDDNNIKAAANIATSKINFATGNMWWEELGITTLTSAGDTITVSSIAARKHLLVIFSLYPTGGAITATVDFNNDTGNNYNSRNGANNTGDATSTSRANIILDGTSSSNSPHYGYFYVSNVAAQEKLVQGATVIQNSAGAANLPTRMAFAGKWANTAAQISRIDVRNVGAGDYAIGSEVIVLGHE